jgi:hypothetical protein
MKPEEANHLINTTAAAEFYILKAFNFLDLNTYARAPDYKEIYWRIGDNLALL